MPDDELYDITDLERNERKLIQSVPRSGRVIREDFTVVNEADIAVETFDQLVIANDLLEQANETLEDIAANTEHGPDDPLTLIGAGSVTVTSAGTPVAVAATQAIKKLVITPLKTNTSYLLTGPVSSVKRPLAPFCSRTYRVDDPSIIFVDANVSGEGFAYELFG